MAKDMPSPYGAKAYIIVLIKLQIIKTLGTITSDISSSGQKV